jgi:signal transduction histidine kinase
MHAIKFAEQDTVGINVYRDDTSITVCVGDGDIRTKPEADHMVDLPTNRIKGALGIELVICNRLIMLHKGQFWASRQNNERNIGLNFSLPLSISGNQE